MALPNGYSNGKYLKKFAALGPYLREKQSLDDCYFFDSLAVCVNSNVTPEKREFWGGWMMLTPNDDGFEYCYHIGVYNSHGSWQAKTLKDNITLDSIEKNVISFHESLSKQLSALGLALSPSAQMAEFKLELSA